MNLQDASKAESGRTTKGLSGGVYYPSLFFPSYYIPPEPPGPVAVNSERILANLMTADKSQYANLVRLQIKLPTSLEEDLKMYSGGFGSRQQSFSQEEATLLFTMFDKQAKKH